MFRGNAALVTKKEISLMPFNAVLDRSVANELRDMTERFSVALAGGNTPRRVL